MEENKLTPSTGYEARMKAKAKRTLKNILIIIGVFIAILYLRSPKFYLFERDRGSSETNTATSSDSKNLEQYLTFPEFPITINIRGSLNDEILSSYQIDKLNYEVLETIGEQYIIKLSISGKCIYASKDNQYRHSIKYKLYNSNEAVSTSGLFYLPLLAEGDKFENIRTNEFSLTPDKYSIVFLAE
ncbi:MAG: hypothetical protein HFE78_08530 [Clostridiales bacterium]|nr:hypothetical protein [Clostridiales bacterium]